MTTGVQVMRVPGSYDESRDPGERDPKERKEERGMIVLTAAMPKCDGRRPKGGWLSPHSEWARDVRRRVQTILAAAASTGRENIVLGAWGCGAFGNDPIAVATVFREELGSARYCGLFRCVVFAIIDPVGTGNLRPFQKVLCNGKLIKK